MSAKNIRGICGSEMWLLFYLSWRYNIGAIKKVIWAHLCIRLSFEATIWQIEQIFVHSSYHYAGSKVNFIKFSATKWNDFVVEMKMVHHRGQWISRFGAFVNEVYCHISWELFLLVVIIFNPWTMNIEHKQMFIGKVSDIRLVSSTIWWLMFLL